MKKLQSGFRVFSSILNTLFSYVWRIIKSIAWGFGAVLFIAFLIVLSPFINWVDDEGHRPSAPPAPLPEPEPKLETPLEAIISLLHDGQHDKARSAAKHFTHRELREAYQSSTRCVDCTAIAAAGFLQGDNIPPGK